MAKLLIEKKQHAAKGTVARSSQTEKSYQVKERCEHSLLSDDQFNLDLPERSTFYLLFCGFIAKTPPQRRSFIVCSTSGGRCTLYS